MAYVINNYVYHPLKAIETRKLACHKVQDHLHSVISFDPRNGIDTVPSLAVLINANEVTVVKCSFLLCRGVTEPSLMVCLIRIITGSRHRAFCPENNP